MVYVLLSYKHFYLLINIFNLRQEQRREDYCSLAWNYHSLLCCYGDHTLGGL